MAPQGMTLKMSNISIHKSLDCFGHGIGVHQTINVVTLKNVAITDAQKVA